MFTMDLPPESAYVRRADGILLPDNKLITSHIPGMFPFISSSSNIEDFQFVSGSNLSQDRATASSTAFTFNNVPLGAPDENRVIIVGAVPFATTNYNPPGYTSLTVGGQSATLLSDGPWNGAQMHPTINSIYYPTGTTATIVFNPSASLNSCGICVWRLVQKNKTPLYYSRYIRASSTINTSGNGGGTGLGYDAAFKTFADGALCGLTQTVNGSDTTNYSSNVTKNFGMDIRSGEWVTGCSAFRTKTENPITITGTVSGTNSGQSFVSFS